VDTSSASSYLQRRDETIAAPATPPGRGALNLVRISGSLAIRAVERLIGKTLKERQWTLASLAEAGQATVAVFRAPHTYTGQDMAEITLFGNPLLTDRLMRRLATEGIRAAGPGEFTFRAFAAGKLDLSQAEAVQQIIEAANPVQLDRAMDGLRGVFSDRIRAFRGQVLEAFALVQAALEFPEEGLNIGEDQISDALLGLQEEAIRLREASARAERFQIFSLVIAGPPNAGKSTLFNTLLGKDRVIVSPEPGTTRDVVRETLWIQGFPLSLADTAGVFNNGNIINMMSNGKSLQALEDAWKILYIVDGSLPREGQIDKILEPYLKHKACVIANKTDLGLHPSWAGKGIPAVSAREGSGLDALWKMLEAWAGDIPDEYGDTPHLVSLRQEQALDGLLGALNRALAQLSEGGSLEIVAQHLQEGVRSIQDLTGEMAPEEVLDGIFSRFCIGK
jgi:tRNA modification GTPase